MVGGSQIAKVADKMEEIGVRTANEWNKLNPDAKTSRSVPIFKNALTKHFNHTGLEVEGLRR